MAEQYPELAEPLGEGLTTIASWARQINRSAAYVSGYWRPQPDWPDPVGQLPPRGRNGGGRPELVYAAADLDRWRKRHQETQPERRSAAVATDLDPGTLVTLGRFAEIAKVDRKTVTQYRGTPGWPAPVNAEVYRLRGLQSFWSVPAELDPGTLLTLERFAGEVAYLPLGEVERCRELRGFPKPVREVYRLGDLLAYWPSRPGKRGPSRSPDDSAVR